MCTPLCTLRTRISVIQLKSKLAIAIVTTSSLGFEMEDEQSWKQTSSQPSHGLAENSKWKCHCTAVVPPWYTMIVLGYSVMTPCQFVFCNIQAIVADPACTVCTTMISVVNPGSSWYGTITTYRSIPVKTLGRPRISTEIRSEEMARFQSFPHQWHRSKNRQYPDMEYLPYRMVTKRSKHIDPTSLFVWKLLVSFF